MVRRNPYLLKDYSGVPSINDEGPLENLIGKVDKVTGFVKTGKADGDLSRYYTNILPITRQSQIAGDVPRNACITYSDKKQLEFVIDLTADTYSNYSTMEIGIPIKFTKKSNKAQQIDANMITVNNFLGHWFTDIDTRRYPDDMMILPTNNSVDICQYSNAQMKNLPEKSVKKLKTMLYSNKPVYLAENVDRRPNNDNDNKKSYPNLTYRIAQLRNYIFEKNVYRIPLTLLCDLGKVNFAMKTDTRQEITRL